MVLSASIGPIWHEYGLDELTLYREIRDCGFHYLDADIDADRLRDLPEGSPEKQAGEKLALLRESGLTPVLAHVRAADPFRDPGRIKQAIRFAGALGIKNAVIPLGFTPNNSRAEYERNNAAYVRELLAAAEGSDVTLLLEHCGSWHTPHYTHSAMELMHLMETLGMPPRLRLSLNVGHLGVAELHPIPEIRLLGKLIRNVDLSDNFGGMPLGVHPEREALGLAPMMGYIDYDRVMQGLKEISYGGGFNLRMDMPRVFPKKSPYCERPLLNVMPAEITRKLVVFGRHLCEHMLSAYGFTGGAA